MKMFTDILERSPIVMWRSIFENTRRMKGVLIRVLHVVSNGLTSEYCIAAYLFSKQVCRLRRKSGLLFTALYLKQCGVVLQKYYGEGSFTPSLLSPFVSLTRKGIPRIIPNFHRKLISVRDDRADRCVKIYLSWLSLARAVMLAPKVTKETFKSLVEVPTSPEAIYKTISSVYSKVEPLLLRYLPNLPSRPVYQGIVWAPTWKATPNRTCAMKKTIPSLYPSLLKELDSFDWVASERKYNLSLLWAVTKLELYFPRVVFPFDRTVEPPGTFDETRAPRQIARLYNAVLETRDWHSPLSSASEGYHPIYARVAASMAGAGKRRLFIIGNYVIQRILKPYHDWFMDTLRSLPSDGTFHQHRPITRVLGSRFVASFDLKSATDRWPRPFLTMVLCNLFGFKQAIRIVEECLGYIPIRVCPPLVTRTTTVKFTIGTPLGFYGAWPIFALSHHLLVWLAAEDVYPGKTFRTYGVLGDDLVIGDRRVSEKYTQLLESLGAEISLTKSLISSRGALEFAKKFFILNSRGDPFDASAVSIRSLLLARSTLGLSTIRTTYSCSLKSCLRLAGAGYRVMARLSPLCVKGRWLRLIVFLSYKPGFSEEAFCWWLCGWKHPINPYQKGRLFHWLLNRVRPRQLKLPSAVDLGEVKEPSLILEFAEYTITRNWCARWLKLLLWYSTVLLESRGDLTPLLNAPVVELSWKRVSVDPTIHRYGLLWRLYDIAAQDVPYGVLADKKGVKEQLQYPVIWRCRVVSLRTVCH